MKFLQVFRKKTTLKVMAQMMLLDIVQATFISNGAKLKMVYMSYKIYVLLS